MDYEKIGFKSGIEIHQQLEGKKLFCDCPALNSTKKPDIEVVRRLRAVAGETGEVDVAASHEMKKGKQFIYVSNSEDTCNVEYDEEPPHAINQQALDVALQVCRILNAKIVDEVQVMRKAVVDGSNTSGFQRTALVGINGHIETSKGRVGIPNICLEEEAAQKVEETDNSVTYKLDRLGIPLIEIGTDASIKDPEHAKEVASYLGMVLRSTGGCKRGIGTIRQDVNLSIKGHPRVEIKGFQDIKSIVKTIDNEVLRQQKEKKGEAHVRKANADFSTTFLRPMPGAARMYPETDVAPIKITADRLAKIGKVELISDKLADLEKKYGIPQDKIKNLIKIDTWRDSGFHFFESMVDKNKNIKPAFIGETLLSFTSEILRTHRGADPAKIKKDHLIKIFDELNKGKIAKNSVMKLLEDIAWGKGLDFSKYELKEIDLEGEIKKIVSSDPGKNPGAYMGMIMGKFKGQVDGKKAMEILKKII